MMSRLILAISMSSLLSIGSCKSKPADSDAFRHNNYGNSVSRSSPSTGNFPAPERVGRSGTSRVEWTIENDTAYTLSLSYDRGSTTTVSIPSRGKKSIDLGGGQYSVKATIPEDPAIEPYAGTITLEAGYSYLNKFYIELSREK